MSGWAYRKGLVELGNGVFAYLQPDGSWGWNNAGMIVDGTHSLVVDTLFDLKLTREMLDIFRAAHPAARQIQALVNTHANGDHCYGNALFTGAEIIASKNTVREMAEVPPKKMAGLMKLAQVASSAGPVLKSVAAMLGTLGLKPAPAMLNSSRFVLKCFGSFDFRAIPLTLPTRTFENQLELSIGNKKVVLLEVGPAHTSGDTLVYLPEHKVLFSGDILFVDGHPIVWEGPVSNWIRACERILELDVDTIVPGHGPITGKGGVRKLKQYLEIISREARLRFDAGLSVQQAARDINLDAYSDWKDAERLVVNVDTLYREFRSDRSKPNVIMMFNEMAEYYYERSGQL